MKNIWGEIIVLPLVTSQLLAFCFFSHEWNLSRRIRDQLHEWNLSRRMRDEFLKIT